MNADPISCSRRPPSTRQPFQSLPNSRKICVTGSRADIGVPMREEAARDRAVIPANINHPEVEPMIIGCNGPAGDARHRQGRASAAWWAEL